MTSLTVIEDTVSISMSYLLDLLAVNHKKVSETLLTVTLLHKKKTRVFSDLFMCHENACMKDFIFIFPGKVLENHVINGRKKQIIK